MVGGVGCHVSLGVLFAIGFKRKVVVRAKLYFLESGNALLPFTSFKAADIKRFCFFSFPLLTLTMKSHSSSLKL